MKRSLLLELKPMADKLCISFKYLEELYYGVGTMVLVLTALP